MRRPHVTKHARKRIERGDAHGLRTRLGASELIELMRSDAALKNGRIYYVYSPVDDKTLKVVTARQGKVIVTVSGTKREPTRMADMVSRARAGRDPGFAIAPIINSFGEQDAMRVTLGTVKVTRGRLRRRDLVEVCSYFGLDRHDRDTITNREVHEMVVAAADAAIANNSVSLTARKKLVCFFHSRDDYVGILPVWLSRELLRHRRPS